MSGLSIAAATSPTTVAPPHGPARGRGRAPLTSPFYLLCLAYVASIPFDNAIAIAGRSVSFYLSAAVVLGFLLTPQLYRGRKYVWSTAGRLAVVFMLISLSIMALSVMWSQNPLAGLQDLLTRVGLVAATLVLALSFADGWTAPLWTYLVSTFATALQAVFAAPSSAPQERLAGASLNQNQAAFYCVVAIAFAIYLFPRVKRNLLRLALFGMIVILVLAALISGSQTGAGALLTIPLVVALGALGRSTWPKRLTALGFAAAAGALAWYVFQVKPTFVPARVWQAFEESNITEDARIVFWRAVWDDRAEWLFFGQGLGSEGEYMRGLGYFHGVHNTFLQVLVEGGLLLAIPFFMMIVMAFLASRHSPYRTPLLLAALSTLLFMMTGLPDYNKVLWFLLTLAIVPAVALPRRRIDSAPRAQAGRPPRATQVYSR